MAIEVSADAEAVRAVGRRVPGAEALLCERLLPRLRVWARRHFARRPDAAEDLVQEALVSILGAAREGRIASAEALPAFALETCRRLASRTVATETRRSQLLAEAAPALEQPSTHQAPVLELRRLARCLEQLGPKAQAVVTLTYFAEETAEAIAEQLGATAVNVRVMRHRALRTLLECMSGGEA